MNELMCFNCHRTPEQVRGWEQEAAIEGMSVEQYAREDGTYNPANGHFCCDDCYLELGMPTAPAPGGWKAP